MKRRLAEVVYNGLDKDQRIDCLEAIRKAANPPGYTVLDIDSLAKGKRSAHEDALNCTEKREAGKFVDLGKIEF